MNSPVKRQSLWILLPVAVLIVLSVYVATIRNTGNCSQQTNRFLGDIRSLVADELNPIIDDGFRLGPTTDIMKRLDELDAKAIKLTIPACNPDTQAAKDALRQYIRETKNYFNIVAGRALYGEGPVQGQLTKVQGAAMDLEIALDDLRR